MSVSHQAEEKAVQNSEQLLSDLRRRSTTIAPLKLRHNNPSRPTTVESLCDWETDKVELLNPKLFKEKQQVTDLQLYQISLV